MARRLVNTDYIAVNGDTFTLELWDMASAAADLDYVVELDGAGIGVDWKAGGDSYAPLVSSTFSATMFITEAQRSAIMPIIYGEDEFRLCVNVLRNGQPWWAGIIHAEQCSEVIGDGYIQVSIGGSDGLAMLDHIDFKDSSGDEFTGFMSASEVVWECLKKIPSTQLWTQVANPGMIEWPLIKPTTATTTTFSYNGTDGVDRGVLDYLRVAPSSFYQTRQADRIKLIGNSLFNRARFNEANFEPAKPVLEDILKSLGAQLCLANGKFHIWDYSERIANASSGPLSVVMHVVTSSNDLEAAATTSSREFDQGDLTFRQGASRRGLYSYRAASQTHVNAGSDVIAANGMPFTDVALLSNDADQNDNWQSELFTQTTAFPDGSSPSLDANSYHTVIGQEASNLEIDSQDGSIRIMMGGKAEYDQSSDADTAVLRLRVQVSNGTTTYRLSRAVRTIVYTSTGTLFTVNVAPGGAYYPKYYSGAYEWIASTDSRYGAAWLEIPLGLDPEVIIEGQVQSILQTDFPNLQFYTPPGMRLQDGTDNVLKPVLDTGARRFVWRHDFQYDFTGITGTIESVSLYDLQLIQDKPLGAHNMVYDATGTLLNVGTSLATPDLYITQQSTGTPVTSAQSPPTLDVFVLNGFTVWAGDGTNDYDIKYRYEPTAQRGYEAADLPSTRLGASFHHNGAARQSRYVASTFDNNTLEDSLRFHSAWDDTDVKNSLGSAVCYSFMQARGIVREAVTGELFSSMPGTSIVYPYNILSTSKLDGEITRYAVGDCSFQFAQCSQRLGLTKVAGVSGLISGTDAYEQGDSKNPNPSRPTINSDTWDRFIGGKVTEVETVTDTFDITDFGGTVVLTDLEDKLDKIQTTSPITDADLGGGTGGSSLLPIFLSRN